MKILLILALPILLVGCTEEEDNNNDNDAAEDLGNGLNFTNGGWVAPTPTPTPAPDTEAPVISLLGANPISLELGSIFTDPGASVTDNIDDNQTILGVGDVDTDTLGTYIVYYNASDSAGNLGRQVTRTVTVQEADNEAPVIRLGGGNPLTIVQGTPFTNPIALVMDNKDSLRTITGSGSVDTSTLGTYTLTYNARDNAGNSATEVIRTVNIVSELMLPNVIGMGTAEALNTLESAGFNIAPRLAQSSWGEGPWGQIIAQEPSAGPLVSSATPIRLTFSIGDPPDPFFYPEVDTQANAPTNVSLTRSKNAIGYTYTISWEDNADNESWYNVVIVNLKQPNIYFEPSGNVPLNSTSYSFATDFEDPQSVTVEVSALNRNGYTSGGKNTWNFE